MHTAVPTGHATSAAMRPPRPAGLMHATAFRRPAATPPPGLQLLGRTPPPRGSGEAVLAPPEGEVRQILAC